MRRTNTRTLCAVGVSAIALMAAPALAQEAVETAPADTPEAAEQDVSEVGEIVVTGFRSSLQQALNIKRREAGAVDAPPAKGRNAGSQTSSNEGGIGRMVNEFLFGTRRRQGAVQAAGKQAVRTVTNRIMRNILGGIRLK